MNEVEVAWAAGLFEGEGSVVWYAREGKRGPRVPSLQMRLGMADKDVVDKWHQLVGCGTRTVRPPGTGGHKAIHEWSIQGRGDIERLVRLLRPHMGQRRGAKMDEVLQICEQLGPAVPKGQRTHCGRGHLLAGDNLRLEKLSSGKWGRRCRTCVRERDRQRAGHTPWREGNGYIAARSTA